MNLQSLHQAYDALKQAYRSALLETVRPHATNGWILYDTGGVDVGLRGRGAYIWFNGSQWWVNHMYAAGKPFDSIQDAITYVETVC